MALEIEGSNPFAHPIPSEAPISPHFIPVMEDARMPHAYEDVLVVRDGDARGNRMVVRLTTSAGRRIFAIGVPQPDIEDRLGPTWAYLFECEGVNLVDAGAHGTLTDLADGIEAAGYSPRDVDRVIITHGHSDHDGAAFRFVRENDAELWAHDVYARTLPFDDGQIQRRLKTPLAAQYGHPQLAQRPLPFVQVVLADRARLCRSQEGRTGARAGSRRRTGGRHADHAHARPLPRRAVRRDGQRRLHRRPRAAGDHAPSHVQGAFLRRGRAGALAGIHRTPTRCTAWRPTYSPCASWRSLAVRSKCCRPTGCSTRAASTSPTSAGSSEIIEHHAERLELALEVVGCSGGTLTDVTRALFPRQSPESPVYHLALTEAVAHVELLHESGDLDIAGDGGLRATGSRNYLRIVGESATAKLAK